MLIWNFGRAFHNLQKTSWPTSEFMPNMLSFPPDFGQATLSFSKGMAYHKWKEKHHYSCPPKNNNYLSQMMFFWFFPIQHEIRLQQGLQFHFEIDSPLVICYAMVLMSSIQIIFHFMYSFAMRPDIYSIWIRHWIQWVSRRGSDVEVDTGSAGIDNSKLANWKSNSKTFILQR